MLALTLLAASLLVADTPRATAAGGGTVSGVRAMWISNAVLGRVGGPQGLAALLDELASLGVNVVFPEAVFRGRTLYPGPYQDPRFSTWPEDPLAAIVREATGRGMEVHPWAWVFAAGIDDIPGPLLAANPAWAHCTAGTAGADAFEDLQVAVGAWLDPSSPQARAFLVREFAGIVERYGVQGLHLDYIRYPDTPCPGAEGLEGGSATATLSMKWPGGASRLRFEEETGVRAAAIEPGSAEEARWRLWREEQVARLVREVRVALLELDPRVQLSAAVIPEIVEARYRYHQNWEHWLANGWVDFVVPMAYSSQPWLLETMLQALAQSGKGEYLIFPGLAVFANDPASLVAQVEQVAAWGFQGVALFAADHLRPGHLEALRRGPLAGGGDLVFRHRPRRSMPDPPIPPTQPPLDRPAEPASDSPLPNLARDATVRVDSSFRGYTPAPLTDGIRHEVVEVGRWAEVAWASGEGPQPHWIELLWEKPQTVERVDIYWALDRGAYYSSRHYRIEVWVDGQWRVVFRHQDPEGTLGVRRHAVWFVPVETDKLRIYQPPGGGPLTRPDLMWVAEVEVYGPAPR